MDRSNSAFLPVLQHLHYSMAPLLGSAIQNPKSAISLPSKPHRNPRNRDGVRLNLLCCFCGGGSKIAGQFLDFQRVDTYNVTMARAPRWTRPAISFCPLIAPTLLCSARPPLRAF